MKKIGVLLLSLLVISSVAFALKTEVKTLSLQAGYGTVMDISINRIPAQSEKYIQGMPFNIEDPGVQYSSNSDAKGRLIAYWSLLSNTKFTLKFDVEPLHHIDDDSNLASVSEDNLLNFMLTFNYDISYGITDEESVSSSFSLNTEDLSITSDRDISSDGFIPERVGNVCSFKIDLVKDLVNFDTAGFIGNLNGGVYFIFTQASSNALEDDSTAAKFKYGNYVSTVTITMEAKE